MNRPSYGDPKTNVKYALVFLWPSLAKALPLSRNLHVELTDEGGEIRVFKVERKNILGKPEVIVQVEASSVDAPTYQLVSHLIVDQRPKLGHKGRNIGAAGGGRIVRFRSGGRHFENVFFLWIYLPW